MKPRVLAVSILVIVASGVAGCRTSQQQDPGTSTGLVYRQPGNPTLIDVPASYRVYPTPKPLVR